MHRNIYLRSVQGLAMLLVVSAISFALLSAAGGDAFSALRDNPQISDKTIEHLRRVYGLDQPWPVRYGRWLVGAVTGDLGESILFRVSVSGLIWARFLNTLMLAAAALLIAVFISLTLSILSVRFRYRALNAFVEGLILLFSSTPRIVLALVALTLTVRFSGLAAGSVSGSFSSVILASAVLAAPLISLFLAQAREGLIAAMNEDFVHYARAKGLSEWSLLVRHALRAALNPFLTLFGLSLGGLLGGSVIVETVLGWPGIGSLIVTAVRGRDVPVVMGVVLVASLAVWIGNTGSEFLQMFNDKRVSNSKQG